MRIITGTARGRRLKTPEGRDIRPTSEVVKEAMFSVIQFDIEGSQVLDLFSGTGQLGIEALSRGAKYCRFIDKSSDCAALTRENIRAAGFENISNVMTADSSDYLRMARYTFDIAFLDPPYSHGTIAAVLPLLEPKMSDRGIAVCEHERGLVLPDSVGRLIKKKTYRYGKTEVTVYRIPFNEED